MKVEEEEAGTLYGGKEKGEESEEERGLREPARIERADRSQLSWRPCDLESALGADHRARLMWEFVTGLDLSRYYEGIKSRGSRAGRPAIDPAILLTLWLYAISEKVGHARELAELCKRDDVYRWICGGVEPNHHTLSDFRTGNGAALDDLLTQTLGVLAHQGIVKLERVAQDGMRVRASAGKKSFHRRKKLKECLREAAAQVAAVKELGEESGMARNARARAAAERAARQRHKRVKQALAELKKVERKQARSRDKRRQEARASTTDADARVLRMADGGYRPAYNVQFATDAEAGIVVGVGVTNGNDQGQIEPMVSDIERRLGQRPEQYLVDGGFTKLASIEKMAGDGVVLYAPVPKPKKVENPHVARHGDSPAVGSWRQRMGTEEAKEIYKTRAPTAERTNADARQWRGLNALGVRGLPKVLSVVMLTALSQNLIRLISLTAGL